MAKCLPHSSFSLFITVGSFLLGRVYEYRTGPRKSEYVPGEYLEHNSTYSATRNSKRHEEAFADIMVRVQEGLKLRNSSSPTITMSARALNAILPQISTAPYEAHQKARTFASRYNKSGQYDIAIDVLFQSARELLKTGQPGSGVDLGGFMLDVYDTKGEKVTPESRGSCTIYPQALRQLITAVRKIDATHRAYRRGRRLEADSNPEVNRVRRVATGA